MYFCESVCVLSAWGFRRTARAWCNRFYSPPRESVLHTRTHPRHIKLSLNSTPHPRRTWVTSGQTCTSACQCVRYRRGSFAELPVWERAGANRSLPFARKYSTHTHAPSIHRTVHEQYSTPAKDMGDPQDNRIGVSAAIHGAHDLIGVFLNVCHLRRRQSRTHNDGDGVVK